jgi:uncharacterized paraquat-inducible protein A
VSWFVYSPGVWRFGFTMYIIVMVCGLTLEISVLRAVHKETHMGYRLEFTLFLVLAVLWTAVCLVQCLINAITGTYFGEDSGCDFQAATLVRASEIDRMINIYCIHLHL